MAPVVAASSHLVPIVVLYVGPDQIMPLTSAIGAIVGLALMFWNRLVGIAYKCWMMVVGRGETPRDTSSK